MNLQMHVHFLFFGNYTPEVVWDRVTFYPLQGYLQTVRVWLVMNDHLIAKLIG